MARYAPRVLIVIASVVAENTLSKLMTTLENRLDGNVSSTVLARYGQVGHQVRKAQRVADSKIDPDRFESLTADFCQYSQARLESNHQHKIEDMGKKAKHPIWQRLTRELRAHYTQNCRGIFTYNDHKPRWIRISGGGMNMETSKEQLVLRFRDSPQAHASRVGMQMP